MSEQLTMLGARSGMEKVEPFASGDIIVKADHRRYVVTRVDDNIHGAVFLCVSLDSGADCVVLEREIAYRSQ